MNDHFLGLVDNTGSILWQDFTVAPWDGVTAHGQNILAQYIRSGRIGVTLNTPSDHPGEPITLPANLDNDDLLLWLRCYMTALDTALEGSEL